ncbi:MAG: DUF6353 family protein [Oscillospiraceae bacterium]
MSKQTLTKVARDMRRSFSKHSPEILMVIGITGMVSSTILAVKATPKAILLIEERKYELGIDVLTPVETVKATWKCYVPAAISCAASVACLIGSNSVNVKRNAALATAYKLSETAFTEYREKVVETIGEKKEQAVRDKVSEEKLKQNPVSKTEVIVTGRGHTLFFDPLSSRYFYSDIEKIKRAVNNLNKEILTDAFDQGVTVNDFYDEIGIPNTATGDNLGWNLKIGLVDIYPSAQMAEEGSEHEGEPCIVLNYSNPPKYELW